MIPSIFLLAWARKISLNEEKNLSYWNHPLHFPPSHPVHTYRSNHALLFFPPRLVFLPFLLFSLPPHRHRLTPVQRQRLPDFFYFYRCAFTPRDPIPSRVGQVYREFIGPINRWSPIVVIHFYSTFFRIADTILIPPLCGPWIHGRVTGCPRFFHPVDTPPCR